MVATKGGVSPANVSTVHCPFDHAIPGAPWRAPNEPQRYDSRPLRDLEYHRAVSRERDARARTQRPGQPEQAAYGKAGEDPPPWAQLLWARKELATRNSGTTGEGGPSVRNDGTPLQRRAVGD